MNKLSHINKHGEATMVDVSGKDKTERIATASGLVVFPQDVFNQLEEAQFSNKKGSIMQTAVIAGIQAVKKTADLIPLCHQLSLSKINIDIQPIENTLRIICTVKCNERTGVEMEALTGVSVSTLTIYDMCKALSHDIKITNIQLEKKSGGKSDFNR
ncbi:cyclic pyranopterin monophosphate synthase MoaC [Galbibacter pacificus]|uniref:cyclic pyranopterin monophosphate synthase n=1 Tax=Galbibacter pacificus TaxID=2996052 RepID=A0ABT6FW87_9FLAO|nr:cyclic pyranopterin monophosphate synthase MoaC [Galbibacter pacificus]MDG3584030.1 cyclic pyranopterin monophosphate synthase MoaC [Galbibacter pacificus]MDG3587533.1 cyclic pyranopterin monophosphate synthase MoaC [Galbibacter pacificus]